MTSIEFLYNELTKVWYDVKSSKELLEQAKEMHKQEIIDAHNKGFEKSGEGWNGEYGLEDMNNISEEIKSEQYYQKTFINKGSDSKCPKCGIVEVEAMTPRTVYGCGSTDYDQRPNTFIQSDKCKSQSPQQEISDDKTKLHWKTSLVIHTPEISDEEIWQKANELGRKTNSSIGAQGFYEGAKWYREQLKQRK